MRESARLASTVDIGNAAVAVVAAAYPGLDRRFMVLIFTMLMILTIARHVRPEFYKNIPGKAYLVMLFWILAISFAEYLLLGWFAMRTPAKDEAPATSGLLVAAFTYGTLLGMPLAILGARKPKLEWKPAAWYMVGLQVGLIVAFLFVSKLFGSVSKDTTDIALLGLIGPVFLLLGGLGVLAAGPQAFSSTPSTSSDSSTGLRLLGFLIIIAALAQSAQFIQLGRTIWRKYGPLEGSPQDAPEGAAEVSADLPTA